jgi:predicted metalloprotease with PDZ domain
MRQAYQRYSSERGYTADELRPVAEGVAGTGLRDWFRKTVSSTEELEYSDLLEVYGLRFVASEKPPGNWKLEVRPDQTDAQKGNLQAWLAPSKSR